MKRMWSFCSAVALLAAVGCGGDPEWRFDLAAPEQRVSVAYLRTLYGGAPVVLTREMAIGGRVVSSDFYGNIHHSLFIEDSTGGIEVRVEAERLYRRFWPGAPVSVRCTGLALGAYGGMISLGMPGQGAYQTDPIPEAEAARYLSVSNERQEPLRAHLLSLREVSPRYLGCLVRFEGVQFAAEEVGRGWCEQYYDEQAGEWVYRSASRRLVDGQGDSLAVYTSAYALFAAEPLPAGNGSIEGILTIFDGVFQLRVCDYHRVALDGPRR